MASVTRAQVTVLVLLLCELLVMHSQHEAALGSSLGAGERSGLCGVHADGSGPP